MKLLISLLVTLFVTQQNSTNPQQVADELLAADRAYSEASGKTDLVTGISAMFTDDVAMPAPGGIAYGRGKATEALQSNPANKGASAVWTPARVAISQDGFHGFTAGFMTIKRADGSVNPAKYLAYWIKQKSAWRVAVYKRTPAKEMAPAMKVSYLLPAQMSYSMLDPAKHERDRESLADAERSFSRDAQTMGIGPAFKQYGSRDAINLGGPETPAFTMGNEAIGSAVGGGAPAGTSPVHWGPEKTIVAITGDFGVTIGYINRNAAGPDGKIPPPSPFFTIWRREANGWRYIAE